ncbi:MAG: FKBP-type peptidyl-prolyl cis-trans isomerase [Bacteroidales bacterium]|nr:FKBP-type peptidyl-prolyl cis-trans isomerase [Bacteroidales bacterium]
MKNALIILTACLMAFATASCHRAKVIDIDTQPQNTLKENMINANRYMAKSEEQQIESYVQRRSWPVTTLGSGVRVWETDRGSGRAIDYEDTVSLTYRLEAINGVVIYEQQQETFVAGRNQTVRGLDAAVRHLHYGSRARVILPSEQAYGVAGDGDRVPTRAILIYDLKIDNK